MDTTCPLTSVDVDKKRGPVFGWDARKVIGNTKIRSLHHVTGMGCGRKFGVHNSNFENVRRGIYERVLYRVVGGKRTSPLVPAASVVQKELESFKVALLGAVPTAHPVTREKFVAMYSGRKRAIYEKASLSLSLRPLNKSDSYLSTFGKCEKLDVSIKPDPAPRVIQPRSPRYNVEVGRYLKRLEKAVVRGIADVWGETTVFKGLNAEDAARAFRMKWDLYKDPVAVSVDATRFDQHVNTTVLSWEHSCYLGMFAPRHHPRLKRLLDMQLRNKGFARLGDGCIKYEVAGRRMSGDMNTGMGNCLLMCAMMWSLREKTKRFSLANNGDDCVIICERGDAAVVRKALPTHFANYGFLMEVEDTVDVFEAIDFCQTHPVFDGESWIMVRDPRVCLDKDTTSVIPLGTAAAAKAWVGAVGECGMSLSGGIPMMQEFYSCLARHGVRTNIWDHPHMDSGFKRMSIGMSRTYKPVSPEARASFWRAFGILPDVQVALEEEFASTVLTLSAGETTSPLYNFRYLWI